METKIPIYGDFNALVVQSYLSMNKLIEASLCVPFERTTYVLKNHGGRVSIGEWIHGEKYRPSIWTVKFSDKVDEKIVKDLSEIIERINEFERERMRRKLVA